MPPRADRGVRGPVTEERFAGWPITEQAATDDDVGQPSPTVQHRTTTTTVSDSPPAPVVAAAPPVTDQPSGGHGGGGGAAESSAPPESGGLAGLFRPGGSLNGLAERPSEQGRSPRATSDANENDRTPDRAGRIDPSRGDRGPNGGIGRGGPSGNGSDTRRSGKGDSDGSGDGRGGRGGGSRH